MNYKSNLAMKFNDLNNKKIAILGLGIENYALVKFLVKNKVDCEITVCDARTKEPLGDRYGLMDGGEIKWRLGKDYDKDLDKFDIIFRSPGYPLFSANLKRALKKSVEVTSAIKLFFEICPSKNIIGVTGTKGKGTTASLIFEILKKARKRVWLGGNIGVAPFEFTSKIKEDDWVVLELSSFQLEDLNISPKIAVITNFYKEHLAAADPNNPNYHRTLSEYKRAKLNIIKFQCEDDFAVVNWSLVTGHWPLGRGKKIYFGKSKLPSNLIGEHNKENIAAAAEAAKIAGVNQKIIESAVKNFKGLEHRLEFIKILNNVKYYNDSFATTPESTIIALKSFDAPIILIAGGADKGADFGLMIKEIKKRCRVLILLRGAGTEKIKKYIHLSYISARGGSPAGRHLSSYEFADLNLAVKKARTIAKNGDVVLLSPGCASFGMFLNYKQRGALFKKFVNRLNKGKRRNGFRNRETKKLRN